MSSISSLSKLILHFPSMPHKKTTCKFILKVVQLSHEEHLASRASEYQSNAKNNFSSLFPRFQNCPLYAGQDRLNCCKQTDPKYTGWSVRQVSLSHYYWSEQSGTGEYQGLHTCLLTHENSQIRTLFLICSNLAFNKINTVAYHCYFQLVFL